MRYLRYANCTFCHSVNALYIQEAADAAKSAMVSVIGLDSEKVQLLCDAANEEVDEADKVQIANFLCSVRNFLLYQCSGDSEESWK